MSDGLPLGMLVCHRQAGQFPGDCQLTVSRFCRQVVALSEAVLLARFGERARFIAASVRGISDEPVQVSFWSRPSPSASDDAVTSHGLLADEACACYCE